MVALIGLSFFWIAFVLHFSSFLYFLNFFIDLPMHKFIKLPKNNFISLKNKIKTLKNITRFNNSDKVMEFKLSDIYISKLLQALNH